MEPNNEPEPSFDIPGLLVAATTALVQVQDILVNVAGQPNLPGTSDWRMSCRKNALRLDAVEPDLALVKSQVAALLVGDLDPRLALVEAGQRRLVADLNANTLSDQAAAAREVARDLKLAAAQASLDALNLKAIAGDQASAEIKAAAARAQATAEAAQAKADTATQAAATARDQAIAARDQAVAAGVAVTSLAARIKTGSVTVPQIGLGTTITVKLTWATPFPTAVYTAVPAAQGLALLGLSADVISQTAADVTIQIKNVLGLAIAAGGSVAVIAIAPAP